MKNGWLNMIGACVLPPLVGVGVCAGLIQVLREHELFRPTGVRAQSPSLFAQATRKNHLSDITAEVRAALPVDAVFSPNTEPRLATDTQKEAIRRAAESAKHATVPAKVRSVEASPITAAAPPARATAHPSSVPIKRPPTDAEVVLTDRRLRLQSDAWPQAYQAVLNGDAEHLAKVIAMGVSPKEKTLGGDTALCAAVRMGRVECVRVLALAGVDVNEAAHEKQPPIALASLRRNAEVLQALIGAGADPNTRFRTPVLQSVIDRCQIKDLRNALESDRGVTPLICCAARGDVEGAVVLMRAGARPGICTTRYHRYPINFAATQGYLFLMRVLLGRDPDSEPDTLVTVDLSSQRAWVTKQGRIINSTSVSTGREGYGTPAGRYVITDKHRTHTSTLYHVAMPWFMRLNCGAIGLHSGYVTGRPASHGCIRLPHEKARQFFNAVAVGDEVQIVY